MADLVATHRTTLDPEEVIVRAVQYFSSGRWQPSGQSGRTATFRALPPIPWTLMLVTMLGFLACIVPGIVCYILLIKKARQFQNLVVTATLVPGGSEVVISHPPFAAGVVAEFAAALPRAEEPPSAS